MAMIIIIITQQLTNIGCYDNYNDGNRSDNNDNSNDNIDNNNEKKKNNDNSSNNNNKMMKGIGILQNNFLFGLTIHLNRR